jgi:N-acetylneuraminate synthase
VVLKKAILVGEIGLSHEGSLGMAMSMIKASKDANLDYVKFQYHNKLFESTLNETFRINMFPQDASRQDYWERTSFSFDEWKIIINYCKNLGIGFLCTPFSVWSAERLKELGVNEIKISSGDANNWELIEFSKKSFDKIVISIGMSTQIEVNNLVDFMRNYHGEFILMQCTSSYPVEPKNVGLKYLRDLNKFNLKVGLSDHTGLFLVPIAAIAANAAMVEFHVVFSKEQFGPDSLSSLTFQEAKLVSDFRDLWLLINDENFDKDEIAKHLSDTREKFGRGLTLNKKIRTGEKVTLEYFSLKKPKGPLIWTDKEKLIGKKAVRDIDINEHLTWDDFE